MHVRKAESDISSSSSQQLINDFMQAGVHVLSRRYSVSTREGERFHLRTCLLHVKGATIFTEICKENGVQYRWFREAFKARGFW